VRGAPPGAHFACGGCHGRAGTSRTERRIEVGQYNGGKAGGTGDQDGDRPEGDVGGEGRARQDGRTWQEGRTRQERRTRQDGRIRQERRAQHEGDARQQGRPGEEGDHEEYAGRQVSGRGQVRRWSPDLGCRSPDLGQGDADREGGARDPDRAAQRR
jgi:hypothetical protein